ncbi:hypothetical protein [Pedobacter cryoconitis]|uniref:Ribosomal protein S27AE n=1 Tax=Pedobacter cryoconitis TaxID=188932 RepID=A0A7X0J1A0_9SPHI|nr:hypothetical protein [Pedobacter cryoconitis]MBB6499198.1 ribosomal protein S27AE [Pedobacter cryoconitis]
MNEKDKTLSYLERLKQQAVNQENYGGEIKAEEAKMEVRDCPECGAGRAFHQGLTVCAYCGFKFMDIRLTDGLYIRKQNNS